MDIFIYSDESGVFDNIHNEIFVFGGLMFLSSKEMDDAMRLYAHAEQIVRKEEHLEDCCEAKASILSNKSKGKLFRSLNRFHKFGVVVTQRQLHKDIFAEKKSKQRYLDYAFKITVKRQYLLSSKIRFISSSYLKLAFCPPCTGGTCPRPMAQKNFRKLAA